MAYAKSARMFVSQFNTKVLRHNKTENSKNMSKTETLTTYSFKKGWNQVPQGKVKEVKDAIMTALDINAANFYKRLKGDVEPKVSEAAAIEGIFQSYDITEIWGEA